MSEVLGEKVDYYCDPITRKVLIGSIAVNSYIESGGYPIELGPFLRSHDPIDMTGHRRQDYADWTDKDILTSIHWLCSILPTPENPREKILTESILKRANHFGLI